MFIFDGKTYFGTLSSQTQLRSLILWALSTSFQVFYILHFLGFNITFLLYSTPELSNDFWIIFIFFLAFFFFVYLLPLSNISIKQQILGYLGTLPLYTLGIYHISRFIFSLLRLILVFNDAFIVVCVLIASIIISCLWFRRSRLSVATFWLLSSFGISEIASLTGMMGLDLSYFVLSLIGLAYFLLGLEWRPSLKLRGSYLALFLPFLVIGFLKGSSQLSHVQQVELFMVFLLVLAILFYIGIRSSVVIAIALSTGLGILGYYLCVIYLSSYISWWLAFSLTLPFFAFLIYKYWFESVITLPNPIHQPPHPAQLKQPPISITLTSQQAITPPRRATLIKTFRWPTIQEYVGAFQNLSVHILDPELKKGSVELDKSGFPRVVSGNFACVFKVQCGNNIYAVRCFYNSKIEDLEKRYMLISDTLNNARLPFFVKFKYLPHGIRIGGKEYPVLKMEWAPGELLNKFIDKNLKNKNLLIRVAKEFGECVVKMQRNKIAHGDLQHGNIKVFVDPQSSSVRLYFVDYDCLYVQSLSSNKSPEIGHPNYQHPKRNESHYSENLDNFSALVIYLSLIAVAEDPTVWNRYHDDECMIFTKSDFENPQRSKLFQELLKSQSNKVRQLTVLLQKALKDDPLSNKIRPDYFMKI